MFPDPTIRWRPIPSAMDGMKAPPFVLDRGLWRGRLNLLVLECSPGLRAYGVSIACEIYGAFEEMIYSVAPHGDGSAAYDGGVYLKEATSSALLDAFRSADLIHRSIRQFLFVGGNYCYETLGQSEPIIRSFATREDGYAWAPNNEV